MDAQNFSVGGRLGQGLAGMMAGNAQSKILKAQAQDELNTGAEQELRIRNQARQTIGRQAAAQGSNGFLGGTGSALDYLMESQVNAELDQMAVRREAATKATALDDEATMRKNAGTSQLVSGLFGAYGASVAQKDDWADARRGQIDPAAYS